MELIRVWDLPVRIGHWLMAGAFLLAWLTGESEEWRLIHVLAGGTVLAVALFRIVWGFVGSRYARFADFVKWPAAAFAYLRSMVQPNPHHYIGHNPAGGWAILIMLGLAVATGAAGWLTYQEIGGEWLEEAHEIAANTLFLVVLVHIAGVMAGSLVHRENLPRTMVTGLKPGRAEEAIASGRPLAAVVLLVWVAALAWWLSR